MCFSPRIGGAFSGREGTDDCSTFFTRSRRLPETDSKALGKNIVIRWGAAHEIERKGGFVSVGYDNLGISDRRRREFST
jgi:hypothetical protein